MPRPRKCRRINNTPEVTYFKPRGVPLRELAEIYLPLEGFEAVRLADYEGMNHEAAAREMHVSRQTFGRILAAARGTVAKALVDGLALRIHGGNYRMSGATDYGAAADSGDAPGSYGQAAGGRRGFGTGIEKEFAEMKKIAISSEGPTLDDRVDPRFGRAAGFIIVDPETMAFEYVENGAAQVRAQGAGIQAAETVARAGAQAVLTGFVGPKAFQALAAADIRIAQDLDNMSVRQAIERVKSGAVVWATLSEAKGQGA
jgi:predicted DNA-binding protein (UPF0251 family)/predicted Fe-Mo cluster-binding NifX family protein